MCKRHLLTLDEMYQSVIAFYRDQIQQQYDDEAINESAYKEKMKRLNDYHQMLWNMALREDKCFTFPHPVYGPFAPAKLVYVADMKKKVSHTRIMLAEALNENVWWINLELSKHTIMSGKNTMCGTEDCMNPTHWKIRVSKTRPTPLLIYRHGTLEDRIYANDQH